MKIAALPKPKPGTFIDLAGKVFGKLTVIKTAGKNPKNGAFQWECQCECGSIVKMDGFYLRSGRRTSCGCDKKPAVPSHAVVENHEITEAAKNPIVVELASPVPAFQEITPGSQFGKLIVLEVAGESSYKGEKSPLWECKCACGRTIKTTAAALLDAKILSCGCDKKSELKAIKEYTQRPSPPTQKLIDHTGQRFGALVVKERDVSINRGQASWKCACDCGTIVSVLGQALRSGRKTSCGCGITPKAESTFPDGFPASLTTARPRTGTRRRKAAKIKSTIQDMQTEIKRADMTPLEFIETLRRIQRDLDNLLDIALKKLFANK